MYHWILPLLVLIVPTYAAPNQDGYGWEPDEQDSGWVDTAGFGLPELEDVEVVENGNGQVYFVTVTPVGTTPVDPPAKLVAVPGSDLDGPALLPLLLNDVRANLAPGRSVVGEPTMVRRQICGDELEGWTFVTEGGGEPRRYEVFTWVAGGAPRGLVAWSQTQDDKYLDVVEAVRDSVIAYDLPPAPTRHVSFGVFSIQIPLASSFEVQMDPQGSHRAVLRGPEVECTFLVSGQDQIQPENALADWLRRRETDVALDASRIGASVKSHHSTALSLDGWLLRGQRTELLLQDGSLAGVQDFGLVCDQRVLSFSFTNRAADATPAHDRMRTILNTLVHQHDQRAMSNARGSRAGAHVGDVRLALPAGLPVLEHDEGEPRWVIQAGAPQGRGPRIVVEVVDAPVDEVSLADQGVALARNLGRWNDRGTELQVVLGETATLEAPLLGATRIGFVGALVVDGSPHIARVFAAPLPALAADGRQRTLLAGLVAPRPDPDAELILRQVMDGIQRVDDPGARIAQRTWSYMSTGKERDILFRSSVDFESVTIVDATGARLDVMSWDVQPEAERDLPALRAAIQDRENTADLILRSQAGSHPDGVHMPRTTESARGFAHFGGAETFRVARTTWLEPPGAKGVGVKVAHTDREIHVAHAERDDFSITTAAPTDDSKAAAALVAMCERFQIERPLPHPPVMLVTGGLRVLVPQDLQATTSFNGRSSRLILEDGEGTFSAGIFASALLPGIDPVDFTDRVFEQLKIAVHEEAAAIFGGDGAEVTTETGATDHHLFSNGPRSAHAVSSVGGVAKQGFVVSTIHDRPWMRHGTLTTAIAGIEPVAARVAPLLTGADRIPTVLHLGNADHALELPVKDWHLEEPLGVGDAWVIRSQVDRTRGRLVLDESGFRIEADGDAEVSSSLIEAVRTATPEQAALELETREVLLGSTRFQLQVPVGATMIPDRHGTTIDVPGGTRLRLSATGPSDPIRAKAFSKAARLASDPSEVVETRALDVLRLIAGRPSEGLRFHVEHPYQDLVREVHAVPLDGLTLILESEHSANSSTERRQAHAMLDSLRLAKSD